MTIGTKLYLRAVLAMVVVLFSITLRERFLDERKLMCFELFWLR